MQCQRENKIKQLHKETCSTYSYLQVTKDTSTDEGVIQTRNYPLIYLMIFVIYPTGMLRGPGKQYFNDYY